MTLVKVILHAPSPRPCLGHLSPLTVSVSHREQDSLTQQNWHPSPLARSMTEEAVYSFSFFPQWLRSCSKAMKCTHAPKQWNDSSAQTSDMSPATCKTKYRSLSPAVKALCCMIILFTESKAFRARKGRESFHSRRDGVSSQPSALQNQPEIMVLKVAAHWNHMGALRTRLAAPRTHGITISGGANQDITGFKSSLRVSNVEPREPLPHTDRNMISRAGIQKSVFLNKHSGDCNVKPILRTGPVQLS